MSRRQQELVLLRERIAAHRMLMQLEVALLRTELRSAFGPAAAAVKTGRGVGGWLARGWRLLKWLRELRRPAQPTAEGIPWRLLLALVPPAYGVWQWWRHRRG
jgi:hypothetical protein